jgi:hypothetical protein
VFNASPKIRKGQPSAILKKFAEKMGYRWQENTDNPELGYDLQLFKPGYTFLLRVLVIRNMIGPDVFYEDRFAEELREIWLRTRHERTYRRLRVLDVAVAEIGFWEPDGYVNRYAKD